MTTPRRLTALVVVGVVVASALAVGIGRARSTGAGQAAATPLSKACGSKLVIQTDWFPEPEHGAVYQLAGTRGSFDKSKGRYTGSVQGVKIEIRAGGPYTGFQQPISQMYQDSSITLGFATTDEQIQLSKKLPLVSIVAQFEYSPQILFWNPRKIPGINRFSQIRGTGKTVLVFAGGAWPEYLAGRGWIGSNQLDTSYDGSSARFVAADGGFFQQGFVTSEPWIYQHDIPQYGKSVKYLLIKNSGYQPYPQTLAAKPSVIRSKAACFKRLVPLVQRAQIAYVRRPGPVNRLLERLVKELNSFWKLTPAGDAYNVRTQRRLGLVQNGPNCTLGDFNLKRVQKTIRQDLPIFRRKNVSTVKANVKASDLVTNRFVDKKIGLPTKGCKKK